MVIKYGKRRGFIYKIPHILTDPKRLFNSFTKKESRRDVTCVIAVLNEQRYIKYAILSSMVFVSRYIIVDKNGETVPLVKEMADKYGLEVDCYVKDLNYAESKKYGVDKADGTWILCQDGDELVSPYVDLGSFLVFEDTYFRTRKNIVTEDFMTPVINNGYHSFLFHNNGTVHIPDLINKKGGPVDTPRMCGRGIHLGGIALFNLSDGDLAKDQRLVPYDTKLQGEIPRNVIDALEGKDV